VPFKVFSEGREQRLEMGFSLQSIR
jgi:hypothetical protein